MKLDPAGLWVVSAALLCAVAGGQAQGLKTGNNAGARPRPVVQP